MSTFTVQRLATTDEIAAEMDRRGAVIERLETSLRHWREECGKLHVQIIGLREALHPLAALQVPDKPQGNAGFYSIRHSDIQRAKKVCNYPDCDGGYATGYCQNDCAVAICPDCRGERRGPDGHLCSRCNGSAQISRSKLRPGEVAPFEG